MRKIHTLISLFVISFSPSAFPQVIKLVGTGDAGNARQGSSVSISSDGNTAIIVGPADSNWVGAAWIFVRTGRVWSQQGSKLVGTGAINYREWSHGLSVSVSSDGNTAIVGSCTDNNNEGAAWIFIRTGNLWSQQGKKLVGIGGHRHAEQGYAVSISSDGNTVIIGAPSDYDGKLNIGGAWIFIRSGGTWTQQGEKLAGTGAGIDSTKQFGKSIKQGAAVAISADGNTAIVGGDDDNNGTGAAWIFVRTGGVWSQQGSKLVGTGAVKEGGYGMGSQGYSVSLASDGNTAVIGDPDDNNRAGAAWIFVRSEGMWTQQGNKLVGKDAINDSHYGACQGHSVSISSDGNTIIEGGFNDNKGTGAAWVFTRSGGIWTQQGNKLVCTNELTYGYQEYPVSISSDGNTAIIGTPDNNGGTGAAWVYTRSGNVWNNPTNKKDQKQDLPDFWENEYSKFTPSGYYQHILSLPFHNSAKWLRVYSAALNDEYGEQTLRLVVYDPEHKASVFIGNIGSVSYTGNSGGVFYPFAITKDDRKIILEAHMGDPGAGGGRVNYGYAMISLGSKQDTNYWINDFTSVAKGGARFYDSYSKVIYIDDGDKTPYNTMPGPSNNGAVVFRDLLKADDAKKILEEDDSRYEIKEIDEKNQLLKLLVTKYTYSKDCPRNENSESCAEKKYIKRAVKLP